jgi:hypothetical protein
MAPQNSPPADRYLPVFGLKSDVRLLLEEQGVTLVASDGARIFLPDTDAMRISEVIFDTLLDAVPAVGSDRERA